MIHSSEEKLCVDAQVKVVKEMQTVHIETKRESAIPQSMQHYYAVIIIFNTKTIPVALRCTGEKAV